MMLITGAVEVKQCSMIGGLGGTPDVFSSLVVPGRSAKSLCDLIERVVMTGATIIADDR